jgi:N12 class adenine-specific DNA methylase
VKAFAGDPDHPLLLSLEEFNPETKRATKTAIFDRRTLERYRPVERVETASEALLVSLNETGQISWPRMESLTGHSASELQDELGSLVYRNPEGGAWETADRYLSGNVRAKLAVAQASEQIDPAYHRNAEALRAVQPKDLEPGDIEARLGSSWIPPSDTHEIAFIHDAETDTAKKLLFDAVNAGRICPASTLSTSVPRMSCFGGAFGLR